MKTEIEALLHNQLQSWNLAKSNFEALKQVKIKNLNVNGATFKVQFNPARIVSSGAKVDAKSIQERKCFLCARNRPEEQIGLSFGQHYTILVNPFPIFPKHFTISDVEHVPQMILGRFGDILDLAEYMNDYVIFYNGPKCGASAPDHVHFQAGNKGLLPLQKKWRKYIKTIIIDSDRIKFYKVNYGFPLFLFETKDKQKGIELFAKFLNALPKNEVEKEPRMNILAWFEDGKYLTVIIPRAGHRPTCYFAEGEENLLISPASVDLGGVFITPLEKDFEKITAKNIAEILKQVCLNEKKIQEIIEKII